MYTVHAFLKNTVQEKKRKTKNRKQNKIRICNHRSLCISKVNNFETDFFVLKK